MARVVKKEKVQVEGTAKKSKLPFIIGGIVALAAIIGTIVFFILSSGGKTEFDDFFSGRHIDFEELNNFRNPNSQEDYGDFPDAFYVFVYHPDFDSFEDVWDETIFQRVETMIKEYKNYTKEVEANERTKGLYFYNLSTEDNDQILENEDFHKVTLADGPFLLKYKGDSQSTGFVDEMYKGFGPLKQELVQAQGFFKV